MSLTLLDRHLPASGTRPSVSTCASPGQLPILATVVDRAVACALLLLAGIAALERWNAGRWPAILVLWLPALLVAAFVVAAATIQGSLPALLGPNELAALRAIPTEPLVVFGAGLLVGVQVVIGLGYLAAALLAYRGFRRHQRNLDAFLAIGLVVAAFSQVQSAIHPGVYGSLVTVGDLLRVLFYIAPAPGARPQRAADQMSARCGVANAELRRPARGRCRACHGRRACTSRPRDP